MIRKHLAAAVLAVLASAAIAQEAAPYTVAEGNKVDAKTLKGWKTWRQAACERCHGANQEGMVGPSLTDSLKALSKDDFTKTVLDGRAEKGMPPHPFLKGEKIDALYSFLKGRSDGKIAPGKVFGIDE